MIVLPDGSFTFNIEAGELVRGLRPSQHTPRNMRYLSSAVGAIGYDEVIKSVQNLNDLLIDTDIIADGFPFPQLFTLPRMIIVCGVSQVYEYILGVLTLKATVAPSSTWTVVSFHHYVYMSNSKVALVRDPNSGEYSETEEFPSASSICDFNGQVIVGSPNVEI